jgi:queuine tRNA-ribosyltransferase
LTRNGQFLTKHGALNIKKERFKEDLLPPDPECSCKVCRKYSRAYIRHLFTVGEYLAGNMITYHNLHFYLEMTSSAREAIIADKFDEFYTKFYNNYQSNLWN